MVLSVKLSSSSGDSMSAAINFVLSIINTWWNFQLPFGISFGVLISVSIGIPILWWAFRRFLGGG